MELGANNKSNLKWIFAVVIFSFSLYSFVKRDISRNQPSFVNGAIISVVGPLQNAINKGQNFFSALWDLYLLNINAAQDNKILNKKIANLQQEIFSFVEIEKENERLRALLVFPKEQKFKNIIAEVSGWDINSLHKMIRLNRGEVDGVKAESPVYTPDGLVGFVYKVYKNYSDVVTILGVNSRVEVLLSNQRTHGILEGISSDVCLIKYVDQNIDVKLHDIAVTSGLGNIYPKGIKVGKIVKIEKESFGITQEIILKPSVNFNNLEEVIIGITNE